MHLIPTLGQKKADAITTEVVSSSNVDEHDAPKTVNNVLTV